MGKCTHIAIVLAGGRGSRMKSSVPKQYMLLNEKPVLYYSLKAMEDSFIDAVILVCGAGEDGYCNGHNQLLNAAEYHRSSEINVAATDAILILGNLWDVEDDFTYDTAKMEAFLVPAGTAVELYATTIHYAPCGPDNKGFQVAVVLPKGTNYELTTKHAECPVCGGEDALITATNKWLIGHEEGGLPKGSFIGLKGKNLNVAE